MDVFEKKYGVRTDKKIEDFHRNRRMFCIHQNKLFIAEPNLPYSHAVWFEKNGWISKEKDGLMDRIVRGIIDKKGDIYFYSGYDFKINKEIELIFLTYLKELSEKIRLDPHSRIFGGWPIKKGYGELKDNL